MVATLRFVVVKNDARSVGWRVKAFEMMSGLFESAVQEEAFPGLWVQRLRVQGIH
jgi:hypothetical protein